MNREKQNNQLVQMYRDLGEIFNEEYEKRRLITPQNTAEKMTEKGYRKQSENTVELPCKVGDTVYRVKKRRGVWCILPREVVSITYRLDYLYRVVWEIFTTETDTLGKDVFLTEAEAEEALAKMKGGME